MSCLALANKAWLITSQVSARIAAIVWCSTDFFGDHRNGRRAGSGANSRHEQNASVRALGPQAPSTAFHTSGAGWPRTSRRPSPNCPFRMRCSNSMPAIVIAALLDPLNRASRRCAA